MLSEVAPFSATVGVAWDRSVELHSAGSRSAGSHSACHLERGLLSAHPPTARLQWAALCSPPLVVEKLSGPAEAMRPVVASLAAVRLEATHSRPTPPTAIQARLLLLRCWVFSYQLDRDHSGRHLPFGARLLPPLFPRRHLRRFPSADLPIPALVQSVV